MGCVRDLKLNEITAGNPAYSQGTVPCFQTSLQPGVYFSGQGGHMAIGSYQQPPVLLCLLVWVLDVLTESPASLPADESLVLSRDLEIQLEVRPISDSGLLLHAGTSPDQHMTLVLREREVRASITYSVNKAVQ